MSVMSDTPGGQSQTLDYRAGLKKSDPEQHLHGEEP